MSRVPAFTVARRILVVAALCVVGSCADRPTEPRSPDASSSLLGSSSPSAALVECPTSLSQSTDPITIGVGGGTISLGGTSVVIPQGALLGDTQFTLTIPASKYVEVRIKATGQDYFNFLLPVTVTIDYARCTRSDVLSKPLSVYYIDSETKALLERMTVTLDSKLTKSVTFTTDHLSGYAIAF